MRQDWEHGHRFRGGRDRAGRRPQIGGPRRWGLAGFRQLDPRHPAFVTGEEIRLSSDGKKRTQSAFFLQSCDTAPEPLGIIGFPRVASLGLFQTPGSSALQSREIERTRPRCLREE